MSELRRLVVASAVAATVTACIPRYVAPAPGITTGTPREKTVVGEPEKLTVRHLLDRLGDCAPLWCVADSVPGRARCACLTSPPTVQPK